jgi:phosphoribosyl-ATP pyrophosphohydrolase/phosphoribosyl-AMP cyclohydrolase
MDDRNLRLKKLGEEAAELAIACADGDPDRAAEEAADLLYHVAVALRGAGGSLGAVRRVLASRAR